MKRILVVDDDPELVQFVSSHLRQARYEVVRAFNGAEAVRLAKTMHPALIILDINLPDFTGIEVCRELRAHRRTRAIPILILTARNSEADKAAAFELGSDDYVTKPFSAREIVMRVGAILRRTMPPPAPKPTRVGGLTVDPVAHQAKLGGKVLQLSRTEFRLLLHLVERRGAVQSRAVLLDEVWGIDADVNTRTVDITVDRLRKKLGPHGKYLESVRGVGYAIRKFGRGGTW